MPSTELPARDGGLVIGVDLGGTKIAAAIVDADGDVRSSATVATPARDGATAVVEDVAALVARLRRSLDGSSDAVVAVGIGSAGIVDAERGTIVGATDAIAGWAGTPLAEAVADRTGLPTRVVNDVHAHALGERFLAGLDPADDLLLVAIGTGIGGSLLIGGRPHAGAHSASGHVGHVPSPFAIDVPCSCGGVGHAEATGSGPGILASYLRAGGTAADTREVAARAADGDARAVEAIALSARAVGALVGGLVNSVDPAAVVVSGGVPEIGDAWWDPFETQARGELLPALRDVPLRRGVDGGAACIGASRLWFDPRDEEKRTP